MEAKGYVSYFAPKNVRGTDLWSFRLQNEDKWFNLGDKKVPINKGDLITFNYEEKNGRNSVDYRSVRVVDLNVPSSSVGALSHTGINGQGTGGRDNYWESRAARDTDNDKYRKENDLRIQWQSARNAAISVVDILTREKYLKVPEKNSVDVILGKISDLTEQFFLESSDAGTESDTESFETDIPFESTGVNAS